VKDINIYNDSRDRGLEVLLYKEEKTLQQEPKKFKLELVIPFPFNREFNFQFETYISKKSKSSGE
jgi:hypothetical protein